MKITLHDESIDVEVGQKVTFYQYYLTKDNEFGESSEDSKIIECSNCGKKYKISWCYEG